MYICVYVFVYAFYCATHICIARLSCDNVSGCPSHAGIVSKRLKISSNFFSAL